MKLALLLLCLVQDAQMKDLKQACDRMDKLQSYHFKIHVLVGPAEPTVIEGEFVAPSLLHLRSEKFEAAFNGAKKLLKLEGADWAEPAGRGGRRNRLQDAVPPHQWVRKIVEKCPTLKREKSAKIGSTTVDIYVHSLSMNEARDSLEAAGMPFWASLADWSKTKNGVLFYVGRDDLVYKVEQRFQGANRDGRKLDNTITLEFSEWNRAKVRLPDDVKARLDVATK